MFELTTFAVLAWVAIGVVGLGVFILMFRLGCILADVTEPTLLGSILTAAVLYAVVAPLGGLVGYYLALIEPALTGQTGQTGLIFYPGLGLYLVVIWLVSSVVYTVYLGASFKKGLIVAGIQLVLFALLAVLLAALVLVVLAVLQITHRPEADKRASLLSPPAQVRILGTPFSARTRT